MQKDLIPKHRWGVILAGGVGARLRSFTRLVFGDDRPKQFCPLLGGMTLLAHTRQRIARCVSPNRTLFALLSAHQRFYAKELKGVPSTHMVVQPTNRGTLPAILCSLMRITRLDERAVVAFFPSDHYYSDERKFMAGVELALGAAESNPETVILLGAAPTHAEAGYGWVEAEAAVSTRSGDGLLRVKHFWEKPSRESAEDLLERGCIWNTFVMAGRAQAFLDMIRSGSPEVYQACEPLLARHKPATEAEMMRAIYERLTTADFSRLVLCTAPQKLGILSLGDVGWIDLGDPRRVVTMLSQTGVQNEWVTLWHRGATAISTAC
jgi:mannose-1-phosphate guanylyltransferase